MIFCRVGLDYDGSVQDLAKHFRDGRLSATQFSEWDDAELERRLLEVRGIGKVL